MTGEGQKAQLQAAINAKAQERATEEHKNQTRELKYQKDRERQRKESEKAQAEVLELIALAPQIARTAEAADVSLSEFGYWVTGPGKLVRISTDLPDKVDLDAGRMDGSVHYGYYGYALSPAGDIVSLRLSGYIPDGHTGRIKRDDSEPTKLVRMQHVSPEAYREVDEVDELRSALAWFVVDNDLDVDLG